MCSSNEDPRKSRQVEIPPESRQYLQPLRNYGWTCYINTTLQLLARVASIVVFAHWTYTPKQEDKFSGAVQKLLYEMTKEQPKKKVAKRKRSTRGRYGSSKRRTKGGSQQGKTLNPQITKESKRGRSTCPNSKKALCTDVSEKSTVLKPRDLPLPTMSAGVRTSLATAVPLVQERLTGFKKDASQQDAQDFLSGFIASIFNRAAELDIFSASNGLRWTDWLSGQLQGTTLINMICPSCQQGSKIFDTWYLLHVYPNEDNTILESLQGSFKPENVTDAKCDNCGHVGMTRTNHLVALPETLFVQPKVFTNDSMKIERTLNATEPLKLTTPAADGKEEVFNYKLVGLAVHVGGSIGSGHYYALVSKEDGSGSWTMCNDKVIKEVSSRDVTDNYLQCTKEKSTPSLYVYSRQYDSLN